MHLSLAIWTASRIFEFREMLPQYAKANHPYGANTFLWKR
jgi:hypothetical protein